MEKYLQNIVGCFSGHCKQSKYAYKKKMENNMARVLGIDPDFVNVKATTMEGLGPVGNGDGIGAMAAVLIKGPLKNNLTF